MTGSNWLNILYELMEEEGLIDDQVDITKMRELLELAQGEAFLNVNESAHKTVQSVRNH
jgi:hypothetical protein